MRLGRAPKRVGDQGQQAAETPRESQDNYIQTEQLNRKPVARRKPTASSNSSFVSDERCLQSYENTISLMEQGLQDGGHLDAASATAVSEILIKIETGSDLHNRASKLLQDITPW